MQREKYKKRYGKFKQLVLERIEGITECGHRCKIHFMVTVDISIVNGTLCFLTVLRHVST